MADITLVIGNKNYSSWSLRGWLPLKLIGVPFEEVLVPLSRPESKAAILRYSPSGKVPFLRHKGTELWESLAIGEFLAETYPAAQLWPADPAARALARAVAAEMHAGFAALRNDMPMDMRASYPGRGTSDAVRAEIDRITALWRDCRARHGGGGPYLFGTVTIADAMFAPVVSRFVSYGVTLDPVSKTYRDAVWALPALQEWLEAARREPWTIKS